MINRSTAHFVRRLHAAELVHVRDVVAGQQAQIEAQTARIEQLERDLSWSDGPCWEPAMSGAEKLTEAELDAAIAYRLAATVAEVQTPARAEALRHVALDNTAFQRVFHGNAFERAPRLRQRHGWRRTLRALWQWLWQPSPFSACKGRTQ